MWQQKLTKVKISKKGRRGLLTASADVVKIFQITENVLHAHLLR